MAMTVRIRTTHLLSNSQSAARPWLLLLGPFVAWFDRYSIAPMLLPIAHDFRVSAAQVTQAATAYFLLFGVLQLVYGVISDRIGRVRLMRLALVGFALAGLASAAAPNLATLIVARALAGGLVCAIVPTSLVYVADTLAFELRQRVIADLLAVGALGTAAATLAGGIVAQALSWRVAFLAPAVLALVLALAFRWLPESLPSSSRRPPLHQLRRALRSRWLLGLLALAVPEGAAMMGVVTFLAPALEAHGQGPALAGLATATYGIAVLAGTRAVRRASPRLDGGSGIAVGGAFLVGCFLVAGWFQTTPGVLVASVLAGLAYAALQSTFQTWATEVVPDARGTATALSAGAVFMGAALSTAALSGLAEAELYRPLFWLSALLATPVVGVSALLRRRFTANSPA